MEFMSTQRFSQESLAKDHGESEAEIFNPSHDHQSSIQILLRTGSGDRKYSNITIFLQKFEPLN
jgi:stress response protein SCP2